jgi:hypothetical protein
METALHRKLRRVLAAAEAIQDHSNRQKRITLITVTLDYFIYKQAVQGQ